MKNILLLGSDSYSRKMLLQDARIPFEVIGHSADEESIARNQPLSILVAQIAQLKMDHVKMPAGQEGDVAYVLTADTMGVDHNGIVQGKMNNRKEAIASLRALDMTERTVATAFCLDKKVYCNGQWQVRKRVEQVVESKYVFCVPSQWVDEYLEHSLGLSASGAIAIELYGAQFLHAINGSYTTIVGLPMFEVREALQKFGFFS